MTRDSHGEQLAVHVLEPDERAEARAVWEALEAHGEVPLMAGWAWTGTWLEQWGAVVDHRFLVAGDLRAPRAAALVVRRRDPAARVTSLHLGTAGAPVEDDVYVQRNAVAASAPPSADVADALVQAIRRLGHFDELRLDGFIPAHAEVLARAEPSLGIEALPCPTVDLETARTAGGEVLPTLTSNTRYQVRRSLRAYGPVSAEWAQTSEQASDIFAELVALHEARWRRAGEPGAFASERRLAFHQRLIDVLLPRGQVLLFRASTEEGTIGCLYSHVDRGDVLSYQLGLSESRDNKVKPGFVTHALCMQACLERGYDVYDFLSGGGSYKRELSNGTRELVWGRGLRRGLGGRVASWRDAVRAAGRGMRR